MASVKTEAVVGTVCARTGKITYKSRKKLPNAAFALQRQRKYPLFKAGPVRKVKGKAVMTLVPSKRHASNAKGRALQQYEAGNLTAAQYNAIVLKANAVIKLCRGRGTKVGKTKAVMGDKRKINSALRALRVKGKRR